MPKLKNLPSQSQMEADIIQVLKDEGGKATRSKIIETLANKWQLTSEEKEYRTPGGYVYYEHRIDGVAHKLRSEGKISIPERGVWQLREAEPAVEPAPTTAPNRHEELKRKMAEIGKKLGYYTSTEERLVYQHDVLWKRGAYKRDPSHVIEICAGGLLPKDFDALNWANQNVDARGILVAVDDADYRKAIRRFESQPDIVVVKAETVDRLHELVTTDVEFLKLIFGEKY